MITILDYGLGNIGSLKNMFKRINQHVNITSKPSEIIQSNKLVIPGVGSFDAAMDSINNICGLREALDFKALNHKIPILGICLGMQCAVIEFARNVCNLKKSNSTEFDRRTNHPVIDLMPAQKKVIDKGATMRLGKYSCTLSKKSNSYQAYGKININERHRHRYEVNNRYRKQLEKQGLSITGVNKKLDLVEIVEIQDHNWFVGVQFHPELKSRIVNVHPLFKDFISAAIKFKS